jgi:hypothetical protein
MCGRPYSRSANSARSMTSRSLPNPKHSSKSENWGTPGWIADASRLVMGRIDIDPASCAAANRVIKARYYVTKEMNGLKVNWAFPGSTETPARIFLNPPGGKEEDNYSKVKRWWNRLLWHRERPDFGEAMFLAFSIEAMQTTQLDCERSLLEFSTCVFSRRVNFIDLITGEIVTGNTHASSITYVPGRLNKESAFRQVFSQYGDIVICARRRKLLNL